jgi:hypothetical protein
MENTLKKALSKKSFGGRYHGLGIFIFSKMKGDIISLFLRNSFGKY